jgi:surface polysaccharide O-acyltransferase-like enzyme
MPKMARSYIRRIDHAVANTPASRNRVVDLWRVVALGFVVFGHWISASIWVQEDGTVKALNTLEWIPGGDYLTWIFQVMPIFFIVGGYANAAAIYVRAGPFDTSRWITMRVRRLYTPVVPLIVVWVGLVLVLRGSVTDNVLHAGTLSATIPLWFVAVYLTVIVLAPLTHAWWRRSGPASVVLLATMAVAVDIFRFQTDIEAIGWVNYVFVWAFLHQLGYWWYDRHRLDQPLPPLAGAALVAGGLAALVATTSLGWYPVAMVTIPGGGVTNMIPPTFANGLLGIAHAGLIIVLMLPAERWAARVGVWRTVVGVSASMMTIYLWHLTALSLVGAGGIFIADGWLFSFDPGSKAWWLMRPPFFVLLTITLIVLMALFGRFERNINTAGSRMPAPVVAVGIVLSISAVSLMAFVGIMTKNAELNWFIPIIAMAGASLTGSFAVGRRRKLPRLEA